MSGKPTESLQLLLPPIDIAIGAAVLVAIAIAAVVEAAMSISMSILNQLCARATVKNDR